MGFDIYVYMTLKMCPKSGRPYYYGKNFEAVYDLPDIIVPEKMCEYLEGRGKIFHAYTEIFNNENRFDVDVEEFLESYPDWDDVKESSYYDKDDTYWLREDHLGFKRLLEWCRDQHGVFFRVSWSY